MTDDGHSLERWETSVGGGGMGNIKEKKEAYRCIEKRGGKVDGDMGERTRRHISM